MNSGLIRRVFQVWLSLLVLGPFGKHQFVRKVREGRELFGPYHDFHMLIN